MLADKLISKLGALGGNRWTKGQYDRMYFNSEVLGVSCEMYKTGNISYAEIIEWEPLEGVDMDIVNSVTGKISNRSGGAYLRGKYYIDLKTGKIVAGELEERVRYLLKKAEAAIAADAQSEAPSAPKKARKAREHITEQVAGLVFGGVDFGSVEEYKEKTKLIKSSKKLTVADALRYIKDTRRVYNIAKLREVFEACTVDTLRVLAKATAHKMGVKVSSKLRRAELIDLLVKHSNWFFSIFDGRREFGECIEQYRAIQELKAAKSVEQWHKVWGEQFSGQYTSVKERALLSCTKAMLIAGLNLNGTMRMTKQQLLAKYYETKTAA